MNTVTQGWLSWYKNILVNSPYLEGGKHNFLGEDIYFLGNREVSLFMKDHTEESIVSFSKYMDAKVSSPAKNGYKI